MERFGRILQRAERRLEAPEPERSRILMEIAGDLEELYREYRERGLDESEALRKAEWRLAPSEETLRSLGAVHLPAFDRLLGRWSGTARGRFELGVAASLSLAAVGGGLYGVLRSGTASAFSPGLWLVAGLVAIGLGLGATLGYALFVRGERLRGAWRSRVGHVLAAAAATALAGTLAGAVRLSLPISRGPGEAEAVAAGVWSRVCAAAGVSAVRLSGALLLTLVWLLLRLRADTVIRARQELADELGP